MYNYEAENPWLLVDVPCSSVSLKARLLRPSRPPGDEELHRLRVADPALAGQEPLAARGGGDRAMKWAPFPAF